MTNTSSTRDLPSTNAVPRHVAIIMDGNGRWAKKRFLPRVAGHKRGVDTVRAIARACAERGVDFLTLFAFSSENWRRPAEEVTLLKQLFLAALEQELEKLKRNRIRLKIIGEIQPFGEQIVKLARRAEELTAKCDRLTLTITSPNGK